MQYPWVLHFDNKLYFEASREYIVAFEVRSLSREIRKIMKTIRNSLLRGAGPARWRICDLNATFRQIEMSSAHNIGELDPTRELIGDSEIAYFSSVSAIYIHNERP